VSFANSNDYITGRKPVIYPSGTETVAVRFPLDVLIADLALNNVGQIGLLPAGCVPVDIFVDGTDVDTGAAAMVLQFGVLNAAGTDLSTAAADGGKAWGSTTAVNTDFYQRLTFNGNALAAVVPQQVDRKLGLKVVTAPTTPAAGSLGVTVIYRSV
jgi:hypothetical protein